ncbi:unnamed protein product, partial [Pocillopora meandrina]
FFPFFVDSGIYSKLKDSAVAWDERLSLARHAWDSDDCVIPNKQQVLFDWIIQEITLGYKKGAKSVNHELLSGLWLLLLHTLQSQEDLYSPGNLPITLKPQFIQVFTDVFMFKDSVQNGASISTPISCCYAIMSTPHLSASMVAKFESYASFLSALVTLYLQICSERSEEFHLLLEICLQKYLLVQRQQANQRKVFTSMCHQLLEPLIKLRHMLKGFSKICQPMVQCGDQQPEDSWQIGKMEKISCLLELAVTRCLFHKDHMAEYPQALRGQEEKQTESDEPANKKARIFSYPKLLFEKMWEMVESQATVSRMNEDVDTKEAALDILPFLYKEFIKSNRKPNCSASPVEFAFFTEMCQLLGVLNGNNITPSVFTLLHQLLESILHYDIYQVSDDNQNGLVQFNSYDSLVKMVIKTEEPGKAVFQCLDVLLKLNHSLVEPHLDVIWKMLWRTECSAGDAHNSLMNSLISTYVKLRQFDKLVLAILDSLRSLNPSSSGLTSFFNQRFIKAIQGLPLGQITTIWNIFCNEITENYLGNIILQGSEADPGNKLNVKEKLSPQLAVWKKLECVSSVFCSFLLHTSFVGIGEHRKGKTSLSAVGTLLSRTVQEVLDPMVEFSSKVQHDRVKESACFSILLLQRALGDLALFLGDFKIADLDNETTRLLPSVEWIDAMNDFVPGKRNKEILAVLSKDKGRLRYLMSALCIQSIRYALLHENKTAKKKGEGNELKRLVSSVCSSVNDTLWCSASWDRQERSISQGNTLVALWDLISKHAAVILPLCTADQQLQIAHLIIRTITEETQDARQTQLGCITMLDVSMELIQNASFHEMLAMQSSTVCALWVRLRHAIDSGECSTNNLEEKLMKALSSIATLAASDDGILTETCDDDSANNGEQEESIEDSQGEQSAEESSDDDKGENEDSRANETRESDKPRVDNLQPFHSLCFDVTKISNSVLSAEVHSTNWSASAEKIQQHIRVLGFLPLDWLSNENHVRCLIGLFTCDVLLGSNVFQDCSPDTLKPLSLSRHLLSVLFDGSVTRRKFVAHHVLDLDSLHSWLIGSATRLWRQKCTNPATVTAMNLMVRQTRDLFFFTFKYLLRAPFQTVNAVQKTTETLTDELQAFSAEVRDASVDSLEKSLTSYHVVSVVVEGILALCKEVVNSKITSNKMIRISSDVVIKLGPVLLELLRGIVQKLRRKPRNKHPDAQKSTLSDFFFQWPDYIDSFTSLLHIYSVSEQSRKLIRVNEAFKHCEWQEVFDVMLAAVVHNVFETDQMESALPANRHKDRIVRACLRFLRVVCISCVALHLPVDFRVRLLASTLYFLRKLEQNKKNCTEDRKTDDRLRDMKSGLHQSEKIEQSIRKQGRFSDSESITEEGYLLAVSLLEGCDPGLLPELLEGLGDEITIKNIGNACFERLTVVLRVWLRLLSGRFTKDRRKELRPILPKILLAVQSVLQEVKRENLMVVNLATEVMEKILSLGKGMVLPHNAVLVLHSGLIKLVANDKSFPRLFESQYSLLSTLLFQHPEAVYGAVHVFITCVRNLLLSLIQGCDVQNDAAVERNVDKTSAERLKPTELVQSAQKMARLYQEISTHKIAFSKV